MDSILKRIEPHCSQLKFVSLSSTSNETNINLDLKPKNFSSLNKILSEVKKEDNSAKIMFAKNNMISL